MPLPGNSSASSLLFIIKNAMEAVKSWFENKDRKDALDLLDSTIHEKEIQDEASKLSKAIPEQALDSSYEKIDECFKWYRNVLSSDEYYNGEIDIAAKELIECIDKELSRLKAFNEDPPGSVLTKYRGRYGTDG
jgi:hypothetical protein